MNFVGKDNVIELACGVNGLLLIAYAINAIGLVLVNLLATLKLGSKGGSAKLIRIACSAISSFVWYPLCQLRSHKLGML